MGCVTLWTSPQPETSVLWFNLGQVHGQTMMRARDIRHRRHEVSGSAAVVDEAVRLWTRVGKRRSRIDFALYENLDRPHQNVVLVAKRLKVRAA
jgi:hypothetical protein